MRILSSKNALAVMVVAAYLLAHYFLPVLYCIGSQMVFLLLSCPNKNFLPETFAVKVNLLTESPKCEDSVKLVVVVPSVAERFNERSFVRSTWGRQFSSDESVKLIFVVADDSFSNEQIRKESVEYSDILWFDFNEHYHNISLKIFNAFNWIIDGCPTATHVLRADPDIVLFKTGVDKFLSAYSSDKRSIFGYCRSYDCVMRVPSSKTCMPRDWYSDMWYPRYCFGFSYLFSKEVLTEILPAWRKRDYFPLDDILFTGILVDESTSGINRVNFRSAFSYQKYFDNFNCDTLQIAAAAYENVEKSMSAWLAYSQKCGIV